MINVDISIRNTQTGEERVYREEYPYDLAGFFFQWWQHNYRCDCNRSIFFASSHGVELEDEEEADCLPNNVFVVTKMVDADTSQELPLPLTPEQQISGLPYAEEDALIEEAKAEATRLYGD